MIGDCTNLKLENYSLWDSYKPKTENDNLFISNFFALETTINHEHDGRHKVLVVSESCSVRRPNGMLAGNPTSTISIFPNLKEKPSHCVNFEEGCIYSLHNIPKQENKILVVTNNTMVRGGNLCIVDLRLVELNDYYNYEKVRNAPPTAKDVIFLEDSLVCCGNFGEYYYEKYPCKIELFELKTKSSRILDQFATDDNPFQFTCFCKLQTNTTNDPDQKIKRVVVGCHGVRKERTFIRIYDYESCKLLNEIYLFKNRRKLKDWTKHQVTLGRDWGNPLGLGDGSGESSLKRKARTHASHSIHSCFIDSFVSENGKSVIVAGCGNGIHLLDGMTGKKIRVITEGIMPGKKLDVDKYQRHDVFTLLKMPGGNCKYIVERYRKFYFVDFSSVFNQSKERRGKKVVVKYLERSKKEKYISTQSRKNLFWLDQEKGVFLVEWSSPRRRYQSDVLVLVTCSENDRKKEEEEVEGEED